MSVHAPDQGFAFVHIPKAAGWSVKKYLNEMLDGLIVPNSPEVRVGMLDVDRDQIDESLPIGHVALREWEERMGLAPEAYDRIVAIRRQPFEQTYSMFDYLRTQRTRGRGRIMPQHEGAATYGAGVWRTEAEAFTAWLKDPRSEYHVSYNYHDYRPPQPTNESYTDYGGFYAYWLQVDGAVPDNVEVVDVDDVGTRLPELVDDHHDGPPGEVPRANDGGHGEGWRGVLTDESEALIRERFAWSFEQGWWDDVGTSTGGDGE